MKSVPLIVVGGGPAGLMAAGTGAAAGCRVRLLEKMGRTGLKLGISGKGRCNLTNTAPLEEFLPHFGPGGRFLRQCFQQFFSAELATFMESLGVELTVERGGRVFPASGRAMDVVRALERWVSQQGVEIIRDCRATSLIVRENMVTGIRTSQGTHTCSGLILATGGKSYPRTGSTGDGLKMAKQVGHRLTPLQPGLVPLESRSPCLPHLEGLELKNVLVRLFVKARKTGQEFGELLFRQNSLAGPTILRLSRQAVCGLEAGHPVKVIVDLKPALDEARLDARLLRDLATRPREPFPDILRGLLPKQLVQVCIEECELGDNPDPRTFPKKRRKRLVHWLKNFSFEICGHRGWEEAIVTVGGVRLKDVDPRTMMSRKVRNLFFAGELLDLQADTGGYNLQAAFSTGRLAGTTAAQFLTQPT